MGALKYKYVIWNIFFFLSISASADSLPEFVGRHFSEIKENLVELEIELEIQKVDSRVRKDEVLLQIPSAGSQIGVDQRLYLRISKWTSGTQCHW